MTSLQKQLNKLKGSKIILWLNHAELGMVNGTLVMVEPEHLEVLVDNRHVYLVSISSIIAVREVSEVM